MPSPFCEAKGGRGERSETQGVHTATRLKPPCIPPWTSRGRDGLAPLNIKGEGWDHSPSFQSLTSEFKGHRIPLAPLR